MYFMIHATDHPDAPTSKWPDPGTEQVRESPTSCPLLSDKITYSDWPTSRGALGKSSTSRDATASHPRTLIQHGTTPKDKTSRSSFTQSMGRTSGVSDAPDSGSP